MNVCKKTRKDIRCGCAIFDMGILSKISLSRVSKTGCWKYIDKFKELWGRKVDLGTNHSSWDLSTDSRDRDLVCEWRDSCISRGLAMFVLREIPQFVCWMAVGLSCSVTTLLAASEVGSDINENITFFNNVSCTAVMSFTLVLFGLQCLLEQTVKESLKPRAPIFSISLGVVGGLISGYLIVSNYEFLVLVSLIFRIEVKALALSCFAGIFAWSYAFGLLLVYEGLEIC